MGVIFNLSDKYMTGTLGILAVGMAPHEMYGAMQVGDAGGALCPALTNVNHEDSAMGLNSVLFSSFTCPEQCRIGLVRNSFNIVPLCQQPCLPSFTLQDVLTFVAGREREVAAAAATTGGRRARGAEPGGWVGQGVGGSMVVADVSVVGMCSTTLLSGLLLAVALSFTLSTCQPGCSASTDQVLHKSILMIWCCCLEPCVPIHPAGDGGLVSSELRSFRDVQALVKYMAEKSAVVAAALQGTLPVA